MKKIEKILIGNASCDKIGSERNDRNKSSYVWFEEDDIENSRVKLEIGSSVKPDPHKEKELKTYISYSAECIKTQSI